MCEEMKKNKVISIKNLPKRLPVFHAITAALALDRMKAPQWLWGAIGLLFILLTLYVIKSWVRDQETDIFENK